jgi:PEP-CTERM motif
LPLTENGRTIDTAVSLLVSVKTGSVMPAKILFAVASFLLLGLVGGISAPAYAGLDGATVTTTFWMPIPQSFQPPPPAPQIPAPTNPPPLACTPQLACDTLDYLYQGNPVSSPLPILPVDYLLDATSLTQVSVEDTKIVINNTFTGWFCLTQATGCADPFDGFEFVFSSGVDITGATIDSTSTFGLPGQNPGFGAAVAGASVESPTVLVVNLTGVYSVADQSLTIDLTFPTTTPTVPEPSTWALMLLGFAGLGVAGYRRMGAAGGLRRAG